MIRVRLIGGMGNQMFQFAFAYVMSRKLKTPFLLDTWFEKFRLTAFRLKAPYSAFVFSAVYIAYSKMQRKLTFKRTVSNMDCTVTVANHTPLNGTDYVGYFQDGSFYTPYQMELRKLFRIKNKYKEKFYRKYGATLQSFSILVVHVRAGDYRSTKLTEYGGADILLPVNWYLEQLEKIHLRDYKCYLITDDIEYAKQAFGSYADFQFVSDTVMNDFQLLQHADVAIISNSTFAWWASFLNVKPNARILAPRFFLGYHVQKEFPAGIQNISFEWA